VITGRASASKKGVHEDKREGLSLEKGGLAGGIQREGRDCVLWLRTGRNTGGGGGKTTITSF